MTAFTQLVPVFIWLITGTRAVIPRIEKYGVRGGVAKMSLEGFVYNSTEIKWKLGNNVIADQTKGKVNPNYASRVHINRTDASLLLKDLEEKDSGIYRAIHGEWSETTLVEFRLTVEEAVSSPVINVSVLQFNSSGSHCKVSVNCSVKNSWVLYTCEDNSCILSHSKLTNVNITIITKSNLSIQCMASNNVSSSNSTQHLSSMCVSSRLEKLPGDTVPIYVIILSCVTVVAVVLVIGVINSTRFSKVIDENQATVPIVGRRIPEQRSSSRRHLDIHTIYSNVCKSVRAHQAPENSSRGQPSGPPAETEDIDTVYRTVCKNERAVPLPEDNATHDSTAWTLREGRPAPTVMRAPQAASMPVTSASEWSLWQQRPPEDNHVYSNVNMGHPTPSMDTQQTVESVYYTLGELPPANKKETEKTSNCQNTGVVD